MFTYCVAFLARSSDGMTRTEGEWLAQVEILTHAPPPRRIWMGPQFSFKTYQASASFTSSFQVTPNLRGSDSLMDSGEGTKSSDSAVLPSSEGPLADLLADPFDQNNAVQSIHSNPMSMPVTPSTSNTDKERGELSLPSSCPAYLSLLPFASTIIPFPPFLHPYIPTSLSLSFYCTSFPLFPPLLMYVRLFKVNNSCAGIVEVFGSWKNVAPYLEGYTEEVERQHLLEDAISDSKAERVTIAANSSNATPLRGFNPRITK